MLVIIEKYDSNWLYLKFYATLFSKG